MITPISNIKSYCLNSQNNLSFRGNPHNILAKDIFYPSANSAVLRAIAGARSSYGNFKNTLEGIFLGSCESELFRPRKPIASLKFDDENFKSVFNRITLEAKSASQAKEIIREENAIRGRIILKDGTTEQGNQICNKLTKAVREGKIKPKEVRVYREKEMTGYVSKNKISELVNASLDNGQGCSRTEKRKQTGYHAVHIICELDNGYEGELQILGKNIEQLKDVEDVLNRLTNEKYTEPKYAKVKEAYEKLSDEQKMELCRYTKEAYFLERQKELGFYFREGFLKLPKDSTLPPIFDFNNLAKIHGRK